MKHLLVPRFVFTLTLISLCLSLSGCAGSVGEVGISPVATDDEQLAEMSVGQVSCTPDQMDITDHGYPFDDVTREWTVDCFGQIFYCASRPVDPQTDETACELAVYPTWATLRARP